MEKADPKVHGESTQIVQHAGMSEALVVAPVGGEGSVTPVEERDASSWELTVPVDGKLLHDLEQAGEGAITAEQTANNVRQAQCYVEHGRKKGISAAQTDLQQQQTNKEGGEVEKIICRRSERRIGESSTALQAEGRRAPSTAELVAVKSKSHAERAQKNSVPVSPRSSANERPRSENVSAFARKNTIPGVLLGKDVNQRNDKFTYDETEQEQKIDNTATKESQNQTVALEEEKGKTEAAQFASGSCTPLQLMQGERKASGQASIHAYGDKTNEGKGPDVEHSFDGKEHPTTVRPLKLQNKAKPILTKLIPSLNVDFDMGSAALLFDKTSANDESQLRQATKARDEDNSAEHLKNLSPKIGQ
ncbi:hypothetical protein QQP08_009860 [Theobroma cacao]|nr:hypothetical protein QQP08_009860 [Theobroma cacao]